MKQTKILFVAAECTPFFSTGGLGDVIGSLPQALKQKMGRKANLRVVLPLYSALNEKWRKKLKLVLETQVRLSWRTQYCAIYSLVKDSVTYYFIDNEYYFKRDTLYGAYDDGERFAYFGKVVIELMEQLDYYPDIVHAHDWQAAPAVLYLKTAALSESFSQVKTVFTIHNIAFQGVYDLSILQDVFDLSWEAAPLVEYAGALNLMKGAIQVCDLLTTVSPTYAKEILSEEFSFGLHHIIAANTDKLIGILNGIDYEEYDPTAITFGLPFSSEDLQGKYENKLALQKEANLNPEVNTPLFSLIARLTDQKGINLVLSKLAEIMSLGVQLIVLGTGDKVYEEALQAVESYFPGQLKVYLRFDKNLAKTIYAGSDFFLMPSKTEPCGLAQMIAMRYGTLPLVRETGGLCDSVKDVGCGDEGCGFTFKQHSCDDLFWSVCRAKEMYQNEENRVKVIKATMQRDFSWEKSAVTYWEQYIKLIKG